MSSKDLYNFTPGVKWPNLIGLERWGYREALGSWNDGHAGAGQAARDRTDWAASARYACHKKAGECKVAVMDDARTDAELLAAGAREPEAFGVFYQRHEQRIVGYFRQRVASAELAADLTAETFAAALLARPRYKAGKGPAVAWLFGIAHNVLRMSLRRGRVEQKARKRLDMPPLDLTDDLIERIDALRGEATALLAELPAEQREAIKARVLDERDYTDIGRDLRCSPAVVRKRVSRGLDTLRHRLEEA